MKETLIIDIGNTSIKLGRFSAGQLVEDHVMQSEDDVVSFAATQAVTSTIVASVSDVSTTLLDALACSAVQVLTSKTPVPIKNHYKTPTTLGVDRLAAVVGAGALFPDQSNLVIDMGTCITYDFVDSSNNYLGGSISPGMEMRFKAMKQFTSSLPKVSYENGTPLIGNSTKSCMISGVINGIIAELDGVISQYKSKKGHINVIMCGGDANSFESKIKARIFASPKLVLIGLNRILEYNENN